MDTNVPGAAAQVLTVGLLCGCWVRRCQGCRMPAPRGPHTARPLTQDGSTSGQPEEGRANTAQQGAVRGAVWGAALNRWQRERRGSSKSCPGCQDFPAACAETMLEQVFMLQPWRTPHWSRWMYRECSCSPWEGLVGAREKVWRGRCCYGLTTTPIVHGPTSLRAGEVEELGMIWVKVSLRKGIALGEGVLGFLFVSHHPNLF